MEKIRIDISEDVVPLSYVSISSKTLKFLFLSPFPAPSDTIRSEEIISLERQPRKDSRDLILGSVEAAAINGCNNDVITTGK